MNGPVRMRSLQAVVMLSLVWACLAWAPAARAGEWTQVTCTQPDGEPAPFEGWESTNNGGIGSGPINTCERPGGALTAFDSSSGEEETPYAGPMWTYTAPEGSKIAGGALKASLLTPQGQAYVATPQNSSASSADVLVNCQYNIEPCGSSGTGVMTVSIEHVGGTQLFMAAFCVAPTEGAHKCPVGSGGGVNAEISLYAADVELQNSSTPAGTDFAGSLLAPNASGTADLTFNAQDPEGPGVYRVIVDVDGTAVYQGTPESNGGRCASIGVDTNGVSEFLYAQPCKRSVAVDVPVNTTKLSNGSHQLKVIVQDAAGNSSTVYAGTISVANSSGTGATGGGGAAAQIGPGSLLALRGPANGANASDQAKLTARWRGTAKSTRTSRYGQADRVTGRLVTSTGQPISGALLDVSATPAAQGAKSASLASVRTGPMGAWNLTLPRSVSSSTVRFAYRSHVDDTIPVATATLTLRIHAGIDLQIVPRVTSVGHTIVFTGTLHGTPIPPGGKQLVLEASSGGEWVQFRTIATTAKGRYRASYRFKFPGPITYRFRVYAPHEADFPFLEGTSNVVSVYER
jgi:hypothetical protein